VYDGKGECKVQDVKKMGVVMGICKGVFGSIEGRWDMSSKVLHVVYMIALTNVKVLSMSHSKFSSNRGLMSSSSFSITTSYHGIMPIPSGGQQLVRERRKGRYREGSTISYSKVLQLTTEGGIELRCS
jgi:hypothetical protein